MAPSLRGIEEDGCEVSAFRFGGEPESAASPGEIQSGGIRMHAVDGQAFPARRVFRIQADIETLIPSCLDARNGPLGYYEHKDIRDISHTEQAARDYYEHKDIRDIRLRGTGRSVIMNIRT